MHGSQELKGGSTDLKSQPCDDLDKSLYNARHSSIHSNEHSKFVHKYNKDDRETYHLLDMKVTADTAGGRSAKPRKTEPRNSDQ